MPRSGTQLDVGYTGLTISAGRRFAELAHALQRRFRFGPAGPGSTPLLRFTTDRTSCLFAVEPDTGVRVSLWLSDGLAAHGGISRCLFAAQPTKQEYALALEAPFVCDACADFYHCLGAELEVAELHRVLAAVCMASPVA